MNREHRFTTHWTLWASIAIDRTNHYSRIAGTVEPRQNWEFKNILSFSKDSQVHLGNPKTLGSQRLFGMARTIYERENSVAVVIS